MMPSLRLRHPKKAEAEAKEVRIKNREVKSKKSLNNQYRMGNYQFGSVYSFLFGNDYSFPPYGGQGADLTFAA